MVVKNTAGMTSPHDGGARPGVSRPTNATDFFKSLKNRTVSMLCVSFVLRIESP